MDFVLDNSVAMRWLLITPNKMDQAYADSILKSLADHDALVPNLWHLEAANVLLGAEKREEIGIGETERFIAQLEYLPIHTDILTSSQVFTRTITLARAYGLSSYDSAYLELAIRNNLPLATLDKSLRKAAKKADIPLYSKAQ